MKRSEINDLMLQAVEFFEKHHFRLPPFAFWTPDEWRQKGKECDEIRVRKLGWDVTDFGSGRFHEHGLLLFTIRNGNPNDLSGSKPYCEKAMIVEPDQLTPWHYHRSKVEDIINRGGGDLALQLAHTPEGKTLSDYEVTVSVDGVLRTIPAQTELVLHPGESITLTQELPHCFYGGGGGKVLVGEVSSVNDDATDNFFIQPIGRFPTIEEDVPARFLLCNEYPPPRA